MSEMKKKLKENWKSLVLLLAVTLGGGALTGFAVRNSTDFYDTLIKPVFAPPGWLFPIVWGVLYIMMGVAAWLVLQSDSANRLHVTALFFIQLIVNLIWPILFFVQQALGLAFVWLVLLWALVLILLMRMFHINRTAGFLLLPYWIWITFAGVLNFCIAYLNR